MKRITFTALLMAVALVSCLLPVPGYAQAASTVGKGTPLSTTESAITGFAAAATPTQALSSAAAVRMGSLPAGTVAVTVIASGAVNYGDSTILTGDASTGYAPCKKLATGGEVTFNVYPNTIQPQIWFIPTATGAANIAIRLVPHVQR